MAQKLLIRASGPNARIHLTRRRYENPASPPMFCMLLRKHLIGGRIREVTQPNGDRMVSLALDSSNELGDSVKLKLITELTGRGANVILLDADERIMDCLRRIPPSENGSGRAMLPGLRYVYPQLPPGFFPGGAKESEQKEPAVERQTSDSSPTDRIQISELLDERYGHLEQQELRRRHAQSLTKTVRRLRDRQQRKLAAQTEELRRTKNMELVRRQAELLQANLYRVRRGDRALTCEDYFEEDLPEVSIQLDPMKTPQENLAQKFREYRKVKGAKEHLTVLVSEGETLLDYLNSVLEELDRAGSESELQEIRRELETTNLIRGGKNPREGRQTSGKNKSSRAQKRKTEKAAVPLSFRSPDGWEVLVGRNNTQNDELTTKLARRTDFWLHVKNLHGSHVILRCDGREPSEEALRFAANLAVRYSQAKDSGKAAVDYTMVRNVRKPSGALPGRVIYTDYRTVLAEGAEAENEVADHPGAEAGRE